MNTTIDVSELHAATGQAKLADNIAEDERRLHPCLTHFYRVT